MLIVRGRYMSGAGTCPGQVHVRGRYMSGAGTCPRQVHVRGRYMSGAGTCPGQVHVRGRYMSGAGTCPGQVHVRVHVEASVCQCVVFFIAPESYFSVQSSVLQHVISALPCCWLM